MRSYILLISSLLFIGCGKSTSVVDNNTTTNDTNDSNTIVVDRDNNTSSNSTITIDDSIKIKSLGSASTINTTISLGNTPKSLYLVLSNSASSSSTPTITHNAKIVSAPIQKLIETSTLSKRAKILPTPAYIRDFKVTPNSISKNSKIVSTKREKDVEGTTQTFYLDQSGWEPTTATARKIVSNISTNVGVRSLNIWVSNDTFDSGSGCNKAKCVTQDMVDTLADTFLKAGDNNDIFDWVTNIYGKEWDSDANASDSNLIKADGEITILMSDIDNDDSADGGVIGYSWSKDNYLSSEVKGSNERIMFYVDSVMFANNEDKVWDIDSFWPKEMVSTLAHELQHVISFYQKDVLQGSYVESWLGEMLSEALEDLVATKIRYTGPRGVVYTDGSAGESGNTLGRYPLFNANNRVSLTSDIYSLSDYSKVSAFGTFLVRNYGGAKLLRDMMYSSFGDERAVVEAVNKTPNGENKTFANLLSEWGIAVMLSDNSNLDADMPTYNTGDFTYTTYNNITYDMGSINFFNYSPQPNIYTTVGRINSNSNYFYKIGDNLTGDINIELKLNGQTEATVIFK